MELFMKLGGLVFLFEYDCDLVYDSRLYNYISNQQDYDVLIHVNTDFDCIDLPDEKLCMCEDLIHKYFKIDNKNYCLAKGTFGNYFSASVYENLNEIFFYINDNDFDFKIRNLSVIIRLLPLNNIFSYFNRLFLHSSQISLNDNNGILFTGPSGIGKSTQAKLWEEHMNARIICNDRTLILKEDDNYITYGFPLDGSKPIRSNEKKQLKAIIFLKQSAVNTIERLSVTKAISNIMSQLILSDKSNENIDNIMNSVIDLYKNVPVYELSCTKEIDAVYYLKNKLIDDGVIESG